MNIFCSDEKARKTSQILQDFLRNFEKIPNRKHFITFNGNILFTRLGDHSHIMMSSIDALDIDTGGGGGLLSNPSAMYGSTVMTTISPMTTINSDEYARCNRCGYGGCDVRFIGCGCTMHA